MLNVEINFQFFYVIFTISFSLAISEESIVLKNDIARETNELVRAELLLRKLETVRYGDLLRPKISWSLSSKLIFHSYWFSSRLWLSLVFIWSFAFWTMIDVFTSVPGVLPSWTAIWMVMLPLGLNLSHPLIDLKQITHGNLKRDSIILSSSWPKGNYRCYLAHFHYPLHSVFHHFLHCQCLLGVFTFFYCWLKDSV